MISGFDSGTPAPRLAACPPVVMLSGWPLKLWNPIVLVLLTTIEEFATANMLLPRLVVATKSICTYGRFVNSIAFILLRSNFPVFDLKFPKIGLV